MPNKRYIKSDVRPFWVKLFCAVVLCLLLISSLNLNCAAIEPLPSLDRAQTVYLWNEEHNETIVRKTSSEKIYPASMTKIMTGLVAIDLVENRLDEKIALTKEMLSDKKGTSMQLKVGEEVSFRDLLYAAICGGFNDATTALAIASAGSVENFVRLMNEKADFLGAHDTHYTNPTGWHDPTMQTTLSDTVIIAKAAMKNELYVTVSSAAKYTVSANNISKEFTVNNRNGLISSFYAYGYYNRHAKGLIAGMTDEGGYCVATFFEYGGFTYLCIVMGADKQDEVINSYAIANELISYVTYYYGELDVLRADDTVCKLPLSLALSNKDGEDEYMLPCTTGEDVSLFIPYDNKSLSTLELKPYFYYDEFSAPISKGEVVGGVDIYVDGELRGTKPLVAARSVEANSFLLTMENAKNMLFSRGFLLFLIVFIALFSTYFYFAELKAFRKKHKNIKFDRIY